MSHLECVYVCVRAPEWATAPDRGDGGGAAAASGHSTDLTQFVTIVKLFSFLTLKSRLGMKAIVISAELRSLIFQQGAVLSYQFCSLCGPKGAAQRFSRTKRTCHIFNCSYILNGRIFHFSIFFLNERELIKPCKLKNRLVITRGDEMQLLIGF